MFFKRLLIASSIMIMTTVIFNQFNRSEAVRPNKPLSTFPVQIGKWTGKENRFDESVYKNLGVDDSFLCNYWDPDGNQVQLYIGFYQSQREGKLIHSPKNCMPGSGWNIIRTSVEELMIPNADLYKIKVIKLVLEKSLERQIVLYWFQSRGRFIASEYMQKIYLFLDSITRHRTDGSFIRLIAPVVSGNEKQATKNIESFVQLLAPLLQEYIPS